VLLSGGIDSLVCAEEARVAGTLAGCVFVDYQHPAQIPEGWKAFAYCGLRGVPLRVVHAFGLDLGDMGSAHAARVVPARNALLIAAAANAMAALDGDHLVIGANLADQHDYPDCRRGFMNAMGDALGIGVSTPLMGMSKAEVIGRARALGLTRDDAWSCYEAGPERCGACPSCRSADAAWEPG
jgi:7-cyano-7-deazaguanine synthase